MMKQIKFPIQVLIFIFATSLLSCQTKPDKSFKRIPEGLSRTEDLIRVIKPEQDYAYWACIRQDFHELADAKTEIITGHGELQNLMRIKFNEPKEGFKCQKWRCFYYIAYVENDNVKLITNEKQLIKFIGKVKSIEEALLLADLKDLSVDYKRAIGSAYKKTEKGYEFYLARYSNCTVRTEPFKVAIDTLWNLSAKSLGFYYDVDENTCYD